MDTNWRPNQSTDPNMDTSDWRGRLQLESRQRIVNKILDTLKSQLPDSGQEGQNELRKISQRFEDKIFTAATSKSDYLRKISLKMLTLETKSQGTMTNNIPSNQVGPSNKHPGPGLGTQPQVHNPGQQHAISLPNQPPLHQQLLSQNIQNNIASQPNLPPVSSLDQTSIQNVGQNSNMQNMLASSQRQMSARQQIVPQQQQQIVTQQQQQQSQNPQQLPFQQQHQQNFLLSNQLQPQQSVMQPSMMQISLSSIQHNQLPTNVQQSQSMLQQHSQVTRQQQQQTSGIHQQHTPVTQQSILPPQQQLMGSQGNAANMQHSQMLGSQNYVGNMQQAQRLLAQQDNLSNLQQQQIVYQQNNLRNMHQQLGNSIHVLQPQQVLGAQAGHSAMQTSEHSAQVLQQSNVPMQQQSQQNTTNLLPSQGQQPQAAQQQLTPLIQSQPAQLQQQLGLQQQPNSMHRDMQHRLQAPGSLLQHQSVVDQQKQLYQSERPLLETSSTSLDSTAETGQPNGGDWQEEVYKKIKIMKESYLPELSEMYQKVATKLQQHDSLPHQPKTDQLERLKVFKMMLERIITFLQVPKSSILLSLKEKLGSYEKQIINFINTNRPRKAMSSLQPGHLPPAHMHSMSQSQSQVTQVKSHENYMNSQLQTTNMQGSAARMQQNNMASIQHNSMSCVSTAQQNMMKSMQPGSSLDSGHENAMNSLQQVPVNSLQPNSGSVPQQPSSNSLSSQGGVNVIQPNLNPLQPGSSMLQHQQLNQQQKQQMLQSQQFKQQYRQRQLMQRQQILQQQQQLHHPAKQQLPQLQTHQMQQLNQMNDVNDIKIIHEIGVKSGALQQHLSSTEHSAYPHQTMKQGSHVPVSSPQLLQAASPQLPQHSSPQVDQQDHLPSLTKVAAPLQSANSTFVIPSPSPPLASSPMPGDSEKPISAVSPLSKAANIGHQQTGGAAGPAHSLPIGTPGISASPLLAEFSGPDGAHANNALTATSGRSTLTETPIGHLIKAVQSMSSKALSTAVNDIKAVVRLNDRMAGSAPGNGSRVAVGEDLVGMTNCRLQARNFITQDGANGTRKMKRYAKATPMYDISAGSVTDSINLLTAFEASDLDLTAMSRIKKPRVEANHALLEEIKEVNQQLVDTILNISDEDVPIAAVAAAEGAKGTVVKCSYTAVALSPSLKSQYASALMSPIQPLRMLVPTNYPNCSPLFLDKFPVESSKENEDLSAKARERFSIWLRSLSKPMSVGDIARTWDVCARTIISEHAQQCGGGSFSSKYGAWEDCLTT